LKNSKIFEDPFDLFKYLTVYKKLHIKVYWCGAFRICSIFNYILMLMYMGFTI